MRRVDELPNVVPDLFQLKGQLVTEKPKRTVIVGYAFDDAENCYIAVLGKRKTWLWVLALLFLLFLAGFLYESREMFQVSVTIPRSMSCKEGVLEVNIKNSEQSALPVYIEVITADGQAVIAPEELQPGGYIGNKEITTPLKKKSSIVTVRVTATKGIFKSVKEKSVLVYNTGTGGKRE